MRKRAASPGRLQLADLPDVPHEGRARIQAACRDAIDILITKMSAAWKQFIDSDEPYREGRRVTSAERVRALELAQRAIRDAEIDACAYLLDAVASEYLSVDSDPGAYSERLVQVLIPVVITVLPLRRDHEWVSATLRTKVIWLEKQLAARSETQRGAGGYKRSTPSEVIARLKGGRTIESLAGDAKMDIKQIYKVKRGAPVTSHTIGKLAMALGCPPGDLIPIPPPQKARGKGHRN